MSLRPMFFDAGPLIFEYAKDLRYRMTPSEARLWEFLRLKPLGYKFRRQHPMGNYIADFYCSRARLVIEIDGGIHCRPEIKLADHVRQTLIEAQNIRVIRFTNDQIDFHLEECKVSINEILQINKTQTPPPRGPGGRS